MVLLWAIIFGVAGGLIWYCQTYLTITQRKRIFVNILLVLLIGGLISTVYQIITTGTVSFPSARDWD